MHDTPLEESVRRGFALPFLGLRARAERARAGRLAAARHAGLVAPADRRDDQIGRAQGRQADEAGAGFLGLRHRLGDAATASCNSATTSTTATVSEPYADARSRAEPDARPTPLDIAASQRSTPSAWRLAADMLFAELNPGLCPLIRRRHRSRRQEIVMSATSSPSLQAMWKPCSRRRCARSIRRSPRRSSWNSAASATRSS